MLKVNTDKYILIHMQDADILYKTLRSNTFVIGLDLGYNTIGDDGAKLLGQLLQVCLHRSVET